jgi:hypothetical protein
MKLNISSSLKAINGLALDLTQTLSKSKELLDRLSEWHQTFLQQSQKSSEEAAHLHTVSMLGYHYVQMTVFRAVVRPFIVNSSFEPAAGTYELVRDQQDIISFARTGIHSATTSASKFVRDLKEEHFHMFWPHWSQVAISSICFLDLLMASSSPDTEEATLWFRDLHALRKEMRLKSNMLPVLRLGLLRIDAVFWKGVDNVLRLQPHVKDALESSLQPNSS